MPLTRDYRVTIQERARREPEFREMLLTSSVRCLLGGEVSVAKSILRDYIETTMGYDKLAALANTPAEKLASMFQNENDATANDLLKVIIHIQRHEGIQFKVKIVPAEIEDEDDSEMEADVEAEVVAAR